VVEWFPPQLFGRHVRWRAGDFLSFGSALSGWAAAKSNRPAAHWHCEYKHISGLKIQDA